MQMGDPKKTLPLLVVAVLAVGFAIKQVVGGASEPKVLRQAGGAADAAGQAAASGTLVSLQLDQLRVDPFSHPKLAPKNVVDPNMGQTAPAPGPGEGLKPGPLPGANPGPINPGPSGTGLGPVIDKTPPEGWPVPVNPNDKTGIQIEKLTRVTLKAIVKVDQRMAFLAIDGEEARGFRAGDVIKGDLKVVFVNEDSVIVKSSKTTATLKVGQQGDL